MFCCLQHKKKKVKKLNIICVMECGENEDGSRRMISVCHKRQVVRVKMARVEVFQGSP